MFGSVIHDKDIRTPIPNNDGDWVKNFGDLWKQQVEALQSRFAGKIEEVRMPGVDATDLPTVFVKKEAIVEVLAFLRDDPHCAYAFLADITATDEEANPRFEMVYHLLSHAKKCRFRVKSRVGEDELMPSVTGVWPAADWAEREVYDMFGVKFSGHPDLRRILMDERWEGHPLRKDYPLRGYQVFTEPEPIRESLLK